MKRRLSWGAALSLMIIVVAVTVCVTMLVAMRRFNAQVNELSNRQAMYTYVSEADNLVRRNYYGTIDEEVLRHAMVSGGVSGIGDPYAKFLTAEEYATWQETRSGKSTGFGMSVSLDESGQVVIGAVQKGSTAYSAGLQKGDVVTALNKTALGDNPLDTVQEALDTASSIMLTVLRGEEEMAFEISSATFIRESVEYSVIDTIGYLRLKAIAGTTSDQVKTAIAALKDQNVTGVVLDLRGIESGSPESAKDILSLLLPYGLYGYYVDNDGTTELRVEASTQLDVPMAVLVNRKTAGEAELIAAALRQAGAATLVGDTTAGRSKVQECFTLTSDNAAVYITVGEFLLLDKTGWEGKGLTPDVEQSLPSELENALDLLTIDTDAQLKAAITALNTSTEPVTTTTMTTTTTAVEGTGEKTTLDETDTTTAE